MSAKYGRKRLSTEHDGDRERECDDYGIDPRLEDDNAARIERPRSDSPLVCAGVRYVIPGCRQTRRKLTNQLFRDTRHSNSFLNGAAQSCRHNCVETLARVALLSGDSVIAMQGICLHRIMWNRS